MKSVFEIVSQEALPLVRSLVTKKLLESGFSQKQVAERLGITQPAISQYKNNHRGKSSTISQNPGVYEELGRISKRISSGEISIDQATNDIFSACQKVRA